MKRFLARLAWALVDAPRLAALRRRRSLRVHLGCGDDRLPDFVNIDARRTAAADLTMDLRLPRFAPGSVSLAFSNAFFEHLYRDARLPHLRRMRESLEEGGVCCYLGLPYFRNVARFYLEGAPGTAGPRFDLYNVYRYTHGDPEQARGWWLEQLHKSLFDEEELAGLLTGAGFGSFVLFCYGYPGDVHELPVAMGFYARKGNTTTEKAREECLAFLGRFADRRIRLRTMNWLPEEGR